MSCVSTRRVAHVCIQGRYTTTPMDEATRLDMREVVEALVLKGVNWTATNVSTNTMTLTQIRIQLTNNISIPATNLIISILTNLQKHILYISFNIFFIVILFILSVDYCD